MFCHTSAIPLPSLFQLMPAGRARAIARRLAAGGAVSVLLLLVACGGSSGSGPDGGNGTLSGTVRTAGQSTVLEGATIKVGTQQTNSDASGHFELTNLPEGTANVQAGRPGYLLATASVAISAGANTHDFILAAQEIYEFGASAVYVPADVGPLRGVIITLGGPFTSGFVTGDPIVPPGDPALEASLQSLGGSLRALAKSKHMALLGRSATLPNSAASDVQLFDALGTVAGISGHAELTDAPVLTFGLSAGGPEAAGLVSRNPGRAIGLIVRVPVDVTSLTDPAALAVPTLVMQAELDGTVDNPSVVSIFSGNRSRGGLWALAVEPEIDHHVATSLGNSTVINWINTVLTLRLPVTSGDPLIVIGESSGWLGNPTTLEIAAWADYTGTRGSASWLPTQSSADSWQMLGTPAVGGGGAPRRPEKIGANSTKRRFDGMNGIYRGMTIRQ